MTEFEVEDELYRQHYRRGVKTHFLHQGPRVAEPMVWSNTYGKGRIIGISPGHRVETMENGNLQRIIANSIKLILR